jgi:hypothetical protein
VPGVLLLRLSPLGVREDNPDVDPYIDLVKPSCEVERANGDRQMLDVRPPRSFKVNGVANDYY